VSRRRCRAGRAATWSPLECLYALRLAERATEGALTTDEYADWRRGESGSYPSVNAFSTHWPSFTAARTIALKNPEAISPDAWEE
jgi:hypothetical protein